MLNLAQFTGLALKAANLSLVLICVGIIIFVHEFGHFIFCKLFGVATPTFSIGIGPRLLSFKAWGTEFILAAFPVGGYVQPKDTEENDPEDPSNNAPGLSFHELAYWKKMLILFGGIGFNILLAGLLFSWYHFTNPIDEEKIVGLKIVKVQKGSPAYEAELQENDVILGFENQTFDGKDVGYKFYRTTVENNLGNPIKIQYKRLNDTFETTITLRTKEQQVKKRGAMGLTLDPLYNEENQVKRTILQSISCGFSSAINYFAQNMYGIYMLIRYRTISGVDGVGSIITEGMALGIKNFMKMIKFFACISIGLAVINVLPISPMDGGKIAVVSIEALCGRRKIWIVRKISELMSLAFLLVALLVLAMDFSKLGIRTMIFGACALGIWALSSLRQP